MLSLHSFPHAYSCFCPLESFDVVKHSLHSNTSTSLIVNWRLFMSRSCSFTACLRHNVSQSGNHGSCSCCVVGLPEFSYSHQLYLVLVELPKAAWLVCGGKDDRFCYETSRLIIMLLDGKWCQEGVKKLMRLEWEQPHMTCSVTVMHVSAASTTTDSHIPTWNSGWKSP